MLDGRFTRIAILVVLLAPAALAATPTSDLSAAYSTAQDVTDLAVDATGQFAVAAVAYDATRAATGGLPGLPTTNTHKDVYPCDFGPVERPRSGSGCRGLNQASSVSGTLNAPQYVDLVGTATSGGRTASYAVAGPGAFVSYWSVTKDVPEWTKQAEGNLVATNVTLTGDAARVVLALAPATGTANGSRLEVYQASNSTRMWQMPVRDAAGADARPTSLDASRVGNVLAVGTTNGVLLLDPSASIAPSTPGGISQAGSVNQVVLSANGDQVAVAGSNGVFLAAVKREGGNVVVGGASSVFNRGFGEAAQGVALAADGSRFAAAAGSKVYFFRRLDTATLAEPVGDAFDAGARVSDLAYDAKGQLLVVVAGNNVYGFGVGKNTPVWTFDATATAFGAVDGPLRRVSVSDDGMRITVAGKTKVMSYSSALAVSASLASATGATTLAPASTLPLTLTVRNAGSVPDNYSLVVIPPVGWPAASAEGFSLEPEATGTARFNVTAPDGQAPGIYAVEVKIRSAAQSALTGRSDVYVASPAFNITIPRSVVLSIAAPDDKLTLRQGAEQIVPITLRNQGNAEGVVNLSARQELTRGASWDVRFQPEQVRVPPGQSASASMVITAPTDAGSGDRNTITIRAREGETVEVTDQVTAYVDPQFSAEMRAANTSFEIPGGETRTVGVTITNTGNTEDTYNITTTLLPSAATNEWRVTNDTSQVTIGRGQSKTITLTIRAAVAQPRDATVTIKAISQASAEQKETSLTLTLIPKVPTPTEEGNGSLIPGPAPLALVGVVALAALVLRRRSA